VLLDRRRVKFWQRWVFLVMAVLMAAWLVSIPIGRAAGCGGTTSAGKTLDKEIASLQRQTAADPKNADLWKRLGEDLLSRAAAQQQGSSAQTADRQAGAEAYAKYVKLLAKQKGAEAKQARIRALEYLATMYLQLKDYQKAVTVYGQLTDLKPKAAQYFFDMGSIAVNAGDTNTALLAFNRYLELAPNSPEASSVKQWLQQNTPKGSSK
jgi:tetratricopeptide (TPR) repeat protein